MRSRLAKSRRKLTIREIKMAVCIHEKIEQTGPPDWRAEWEGWRTKMKCPTCGFWYIHETPDTLVPTREGEVEPLTVAAAVA